MQHDTERIEDVDIERICPECVEECMTGIVKPAGGAIAEAEIEPEGAVAGIERKSLAEGGYAASITALSFKNPAVSFMYVPR